MKKPLSVSWLLAIAFLSFPPCVLGQTLGTSPQGSGDVNAYIGQLTDTDGSKRLHAAEAIGALGPNGKAAVPALTEMLNSTNPIERMAASMALARIGPEAKVAVPALRKLAGSDADANVKKVAQLAADAIEPPLAEKIKATLLSPYVLATIIALGGGVIAFLILGRGRGDDDEPVKKARTEPMPKPAAKEAKTPAAPAAPATGAATQAAASQDRAARLRGRVSRPLPGFSNYVQDREGPESVKRELIRAQDDLKRIAETQKQLDEHLTSEDLARDPARARALRKDADVYASERYRAEIRVKALEIKMLEVLLGENKAADVELRGRSESTLKQKWDDLRTLCETPSKIVYKSGQWVSVATAPTSPIPDLRAWLRDYDIVLSERTPEEFAEQQPAETVEPPVEHAVEPTAEASVEPTAEASVESPPEEPPPAEESPEEPPPAEESPDKPASA